MKKIIMPLLVTLLLCACASQPEDIAATYVSPNEYKNYSCEELSVELSDINQEVSLMTDSLEQRADTDAAQMGVGLFLLWPTLFFLDGDGPEAVKYALLKGEHQAVTKSYKRRNCKNYVLKDTEENITGS